MGTNTTPRFIIIDDEVINNKLCTIYIAKLFPNAEIIPFTSPQKGLDFIKSTYTETERKDTMLLLDLMMPDLNGWDVLDVFNTFPDAIKQQFNIYILSSSVYIEDKQRASGNSLVFGYFEKPLTIKHLESMFLVKKYKNNFLYRRSTRTYKNEHYFITDEDRQMLDLILPYFQINEVINIKKSIRMAYKDDIVALNNMPFSAYADKIGAFLISAGFANNLCGDPVINTKGIDLMHAGSLKNFEKLTADNGSHTQ